MNVNTLTLAVHAAIALVVIGAATVLLALHDLDSSTAIALIGVGVTLVGGSTAGLAAGAAGAQRPTPSTLEQAQQLVAQARLEPGTPPAPAETTTPPWSGSA